MARGTTTVGRVCETWFVQGIPFLFRVIDGRSKIRVIKGGPKPAVALITGVPKPAAKVRCVAVGTVAAVGVILVLRVQRAAYVRGVIGGRGGHRVRRQGQQHCENRPDP